MTLTMISAAFGGGVLGAYFGALPAFILCGLVGFGGFATQGGIDILGDVAFGYFLGPHIAFAGGVAAAAYAKAIGETNDGTDIVTPLGKYNRPSLYIVGGIAGVIGAFANYLFTEMLNLPVDTVALSVVLGGLITRLTIGKTGVTGSCPIEGKATRPFFPLKESMPNLIVAGAGLGLLSSYYAVEYGAVTLGFCISAASLIFTQMGFGLPATHHITMSSAYAAAATGNIFVGALFGAIASLVGDGAEKTFNSYCDSHIDPPALTISILSLIVFTLLS